MTMRACVYAAILTVSSIALAQPAPDDPVAVAEQLDKAYEASPTPELLLARADAHRAASAILHDTDHARASAQRDAAIDLYKKFLATHPGEELELKARGWLGKLQAQYDEENPREEAARREQAEREREEKIRAEEKRLAAERRTRAEEQRRLDRAVVKEHRDSEVAKARIVKLSGVAAIGGGVVATGLGVYFGLRARSISNDLTSSHVYDTTKINEGQQQDRYMAISYATGAALLAGGAITFWIGRKIDQRVETAPVAVVPTSGGAQLVWSGSF